MLIPEINEHLNKWKDTPCSWIRRLNIVKILNLSKVIYKLNATCMKIEFFIEIHKIILKFIWKCKISGRVKTTLKKKYIVEGIISPNVKAYSIIT